MFYEINIAINGKHLFATAERSCVTYEEAEKLYKLFKERFPESEGYKITCTGWETLGREVFIK